MSAGREFKSEPATRRKRSRIVGGLLIFAAVTVLAVVVIMVALGALVLFTPVEEPASAADRALVVDIRAVAAQIDDYRPQPSRETFLRRQYFDHSFELDYTYARAEGDDLYLKSTLTVAATPGDAEKLFHQRWGLSSAGKILPGATDVKLVERNDIFRWGDQSRLGVIMADGKPVGNLFVARSGATVFYLLVTGACFDAPEAFSSLVLPTLGNSEMSRGREP